MFLFTPTHIEMEYLVFPAEDCTHRQVYFMHVERAMTKTQVS